MFTEKSNPSSVSKKMDNQYSIQWHFYNSTRKYFLFGRDTLLSSLRSNAHLSLLEIGCGTGRNLLKIHEQNPHWKLHGLDASSCMLATAQKAFNQRRPNAAIQLRTGLAQEVTTQLFQRDEPFDHIILSYVLSMTPDWRNVIRQALRNLKEGGTLHIVDFGDLDSMPNWFQRIMERWLTWFNVNPDPLLPDYLKRLEKRNRDQLTLDFLPGRYAILARYRKVPSKTIHDLLLTQ